jgi:hypothetical protein
MGMRSPKNKSTADKLRSWRVTILRQRGQKLGELPAGGARAPDGRLSCPSCTAGVDGSAVSESCLA